MSEHFVFREGYLSFFPWNDHSIGSHHHPFRDSLFPSCHVMWQNQKKEERHGKIVIASWKREWEGWMDMMKTERPMMTLFSVHTLYTPFILMSGVQLIFRSSHHIIILIISSDSVKWAWMDPMDIMMIKGEGENEKKKKIKRNCDPIISWRGIIEKKRTKWLEVQRNPKWHHHLIPCDIMMMMMLRKGVKENLWGWK